MYDLTPSSDTMYFTVSSRACDELAVNLSNRVNSEVLQDKSISLATDNTEAVDYLYINSRGGYKKKQ